VRVIGSCVYVCVYRCALAFLGKSHYVPTWYEYLGVQSIGTHAVGPKHNEPPSPLLARATCSKYATRLPTRQGMRGTLHRSVGPNEEGFVARVHALHEPGCTRGERLNPLSVTTKDTYPNDLWTPGHALGWGTFWTPAVRTRPYGSSHDARLAYCT